jgi:hypothetical protein
MIGKSGTYYRAEIAISDPRQRDIWWREVGAYRYKADAMSAARRLGRGERVRVVCVREECVWASTEALVAAGEKVS